MHVTRVFLVVAALALLVVGCSRDPVSGPEIPVTDLAPTGFDAELVAGEIMAASGWEFAPEVAVPDRVTHRDTKCLGWILDWSREALAGDVFHYTFLVQVGPGEFDRINVHRVVKERRPYRPIRTRHSIFLQHGDAVGFVKFMFGQAAPSAPDDHAAAIHLARGGVDVWGIDQNWVLVPGDVEDFAFMEDWGLDNQIANLRIAMGVVRFVRLFSGGGYTPLNLLGYSSGAVTGYAYLNDEAVMPPGHRHVGGFVCADMNYKYGPELDAYRLNNCADVELYGDRIAAGDFVEPIPFQIVGELAALDPDTESPIFPGFTNLQVALYFGAATFDLAPYHPTWHYWGGTFDAETGFPVDLNFTSIDGATDFMRTGCPWEALRFIYDYSRIMCDEEDVPWDDNLAQVEVPVLYLEPVGGLGESGRYTLGLLGSEDIEIATASLLPPEQVVMDFGHIDLWTADQAPELVWQPLLEWINAHSHHGHGNGPRGHRN